MIHSVEPYESERLFDVTGEEPELKYRLTLTKEELQEISWAAYQGAQYARYHQHDKIADRTCSAVAQQFAHLAKQVADPIHWGHVEEFQFVPPDAVHAPVNLPEIRYASNPISREQWDEAERSFAQRHMIGIDPQLIPATEVLRDC